MVPPAHSHPNLALGVHLGTHISHLHPHTLPSPVRQSHSANRVVARATPAGESARRGPHNILPRGVDSWALQAGPPWLEGRGNQAWMGCFGLTLCYPWASWQAGRSRVPAHTLPTRLPVCFQGLERKDVSLQGPSGTRARPGKHTKPGLKVWAVCVGGAKWRLENTVAVRWSPAWGQMHNRLSKG